MTIISARRRLFRRCRSCRRPGSPAPRRAGRCPAVTIEPQQLADPVAGLRRNRRGGPRAWCPGVDPQQGRRPPDAAIDERGISAGEVKRRDRDAVAEARGHHRRPAPVARPERRGRARAARSSAGSLKPSSRNAACIRSGAHLRRRYGRWRCWRNGPSVSGDGDRPAASDGRVVVDPGSGRSAIGAGASQRWFIERDDAGLHRRGDGDRLEGRAELVDAHRRAVVERASASERPAALGLKVGAEAMAMTSPVWTSSTMPVPPSALIAVDRAGELGFEHRLDAAVDRQARPACRAGPGRAAARSSTRSMPAMPRPSMSVQPSTWPAIAVCG